ncbi:hypothetical protein Q8F55_006196 [Vanrija albida]|uniref:Uncharacterized protein n=1 Tax=Vanrija albida TaxID=181172 RepID=A0ABR3PWM1_9TREE
MAIITGTNYPFDCRDSEVNGDSPAPVDSTGPVAKGESTTPVTGDQPTPVNGCTTPFATFTVENESLFHSQFCSTFFSPLDEHIRKVFLDAKIFRHLYEIQYVSKFAGSSSHGVTILANRHPLSAEAVRKIILDAEAVRKISGFIANTLQCDVVVSSSPNLATYTHRHHKVEAASSERKDTVKFCQCCIWCRR